MNDDFIGFFPKRHTNNRYCTTQEYKTERPRNLQVLSQAVVLDELVSMDRTGVTSVTSGRRQRQAIGKARIAQHRGEADLFHSTFSQKTCDIEGD